MGKNKKKNRSKCKDQSAPAQTAATPHRHSDQEDENRETGAVLNTATSASLSMECDICSERFDGGCRKPRNLQCGHAFCTTCCRSLLGKEHTIICPKCRKKTKEVRNAVELPVNYPLLDLVKDTDSSVTGASAQMGEKGSSGNRGKSLTPRRRGKTSPHGGRCLEVQAEVSMHCAYCHMWLCEDCSSIDHSGPECLLTPYQETLKEMGQAGRAKVMTAVNALEDFSWEGKKYGNTLKSCAAILEMTLDCIKKEQAQLPGILIHSNKIEQDLRETSANRIPRDVEDALGFLDGLDEATNAAQQWAADASTIFKADQVFRLSKTLLQTAVQMHSNIRGPQAAGTVMGLHSINGVDVTLPVDMDGSRLLMNAAWQRTPTAGSRVVKLEHIKSCIDPTCALTFLDISVRGQELGRVFIRLLGSTKRSRCFLMMCTGEAGPSFRGTHFHRVWWVGQRGEHIWAGDHDRGDGSGGTVPRAILCETKEMSDEKTQVPVTDGLVAGRYGESNSTIFRVYTKESTDVTEEFALGRVEYGLQILKDALKMHNNKITDMTISGCGLVVEP